MLYSEVVLKNCSVYLQRDQVGNFWHVYPTKDCVLDEKIGEVYRLKRTRGALGVKVIVYRFPQESYWWSTIEEALESLLDWRKAQDILTTVREQMKNE